MKSTSVLLIGGPIHHNLGGPSIVCSLKQLLPEVMPGAEINVLSFWRDSYQTSDGFTEVPFSPVAFLKHCLKRKFMPLRQIIRLYRRADVVIDYWGLMFTDAKKRSLLMRVMEGFPMLLGKILGKPVIKYTADFGPFVTGVNKRVARFYLNRVNFVMARSQTSSDELKQLKVKTPTIVCPDTALILEPDKPSPDDVAPLALDNLVCLSVSHVAERKAGHDAYIRRMANLCDHLVDTIGVDILVVPNEIAPERPALDDVRVAREIVEVVTSKNRVAVYDKDFTAPQLKGIIAASKMVIASRYHTVVAALSSGVPTLSLSWHTKYRELMSLFAQEAHVCDLAAADTEELISTIMTVWEQRDQIREEISKHIPEVKQGVHRGAEQARDVVLKRLVARKINTVADVLARNLCCSCGACSVTCPHGAVSIQEIDSKGILGPVVDQDACTNCGLCLNTCPGYGVDYEKLNDSVFGRQPDDVVTGNWQEICVAWSTDETIRYHSASGGVVTTILCDLLDRDVIDGVVVVTGDESAPLRPKARVARTREHVIAACGSKYCPVSLDAALKEVLAQDGRYALVGLPCHLHGVRMLEENSPVLRERIVCHLGLMCGKMPTFHATEYFLRQKGLEPSEVSRIIYRDKGWPGKLSVTCKDGEEHSFARSTSDKSFAAQRLFHSAFHFDFIQQRCLTCIDTFAVLSDISLGDAWLPEIKREEKIGKSIIIARTDTGREIIAQQVETGKLVTQPLDVKRLKSNNLTFVKQLGFRMKLFSLVRKTVPRYILPEGARIRPGGSIITRIASMAAFFFFLPTFFSGNRKRWPLVTFFGYVRQVPISCVQIAAKLARKLRGK